MKKTKLMLVLSIGYLISTNALAAYTVIYPMKDITINRMVPETPLIGEWINNGAVNNCSTWTPAVNTVKKDQTFQQSATCIQNQSRKTEERLKNEANGSIKLTGKSTIEYQDISVTIQQNAIGTKSTVKTCSYKMSFGGGFWLQQNANTIYIDWSGSTTQPTPFITGNIPNQTSYVKDGFTYTRGDFVQSSTGSSAYYYVCIE